MEKIFATAVRYPGKIRNLPGLTVAVDDVLVAAQLAEAHGSPGVELLGGDAHLTAKAELSAVGEAGGAVDVDAALSTAAVKRAAWASVRVRMASLWPVE